eukprot:130117-Rhodomonas_salina.1
MGSTVVSSPSAGRLPVDSEAVCPSQVPEAWTDPNPCLLEGSPEVAVWCRCRHCAPNLPHSWPGTRSGSWFL